MCTMSVTSTEAEEAAGRVPLKRRNVQGSSVIVRAIVAALPTRIGWHRMDDAAGETALRDRPSTAGQITRHTSGGDIIAPPRPTPLRCFRSLGPADQAGDQLHDLSFRNTGFDEGCRDSRADLAIEFFARKQDDGELELERAEMLQQR